MTVDLELSVLLPSSDELGYITGLAITDQLLVAAGGTSGQHPTVLATSNVRHFEPRKTPRELGLRDVLVVGDDVFWVCGEYGQLAVSRDRGETWRVLDTGTDACLYALALAPDNAIWTVGSDGYVARVVGERSGEDSSERYAVERVDMQTTARLTALYAVRDEMIALGHDGAIYRSRAGVVAKIATGSTLSLNALAITKHGTWLAIGDGGFIARSPDGAWFSRVRSDLELDLEAITTLADGRIVMVGDRGAILMSTDDGRTWKSIASDLTAHLWSVERFGEGVVIGGDEGLIVKLAPPDDQTWEDRINAFGGVKPLDAVFAGGPAGFIGRGLIAYLDAIGSAPAASSDADSEHVHPHGEHTHSHAHGEHTHSHAHGEHTHTHGEHPHSHDDEEDDEEDDDDGLEHEPSDPAAFEALEPRGTPADFERNYGVRMPVEAAGFFAAVEGRDKWSSFEELRLDTDLLPDVGDKNLFELLVRRDQQTYLGTGLIEAFCGVFGIGSQGNGDTYHMEVHELDGPRQVLHYDHETHAFTGVVADSLDSLVNLAALKHARTKRLVSDEVFEIALRKLRGKVAPTWHFSITDDDPDFVSLDPKRRDTEFFFYRSRWITALLENNGVTEISDLPRLFMADFNQVVPQDQLAARFEACERFIPTALYSIWRAFLFDEPELARYLDIGRRHKARLVRDAATLVDELRAGRNELGSITDVQAYLAEFRALDLDPRRAEQRRAEAEERARVEAVRTAEVEDELSRVPRTSWSDLAWRWLGDGVAHRALLQKLDTAPITAMQIAALDELRHLADDERELVIARLATELTPELEAVLVGSLVRGDDLAGVLPLPEDVEGTHEDEDEDEHDEDDDHVQAAADDESADDKADAEEHEVDADEDDDLEDEDDEDDEDDGDGDRSAGWDAIDAALEPIYKSDEPHGHYGTVVPYMLGGNDPIHGISVYLRTLPVPHFHFVTYGFTDLFEKETDDPEVSGFGFELTLRLVRVATDETVPAWALNFLQNLARYVFGTGNRFAVGHKMGLNGPIAVGHDTQLTAVLFADDPELGEFASEFGSARFLQVVDHS